MPLILIVLSILPVFFLGRYIYNADYEKEPKGLLALLFFMGVGSIAVTLLLSRFLLMVFPIPVGEIEQMNLITLLPYTFLFVGFVEEFSKWIFVYQASYHHPAFNHAYDAIVYSTFVSLGFACLENIIYVFNGGLQTAILRAITAVPGHACYGIMMGYHLGMAKTAEKNGNHELARTQKIKSLLVPFLCHGLYDYLIYGSAFAPVFVFIYIIYVIMLFQNVPKRISQLSYIHFDIGEYSSNVGPSYCPVCGSIIVGKYCQNCGHCHQLDSK